MRDLEHLDRRQAEPARHVRLGVGGEQEVDAAVGDAAGRPRGRSGPRPERRPRPARGRRSEQPPEPVRVPGRARDDRHVRGRARGERRRSSGLVGREPRVEDRVDASCSSTSAAPPTWSRCGCVSTSSASRRTPSASQLVGDARLRRALVDEQRRAGESGRATVALADVEERDPQRRSAAAARRGRAASRPRRRATTASASGSRRRGRPRQSRRGRPAESDGARRAPASPLQRRELRVRQPADHAGAQREVRGEPAVGPAERRRGRRSDRRDERRQRGRARAAAPTTGAARALASTE